jgi:hypothetical protein
MNIGDKIPEILGKDQNGKEIKASDYKGRKIYLELKKIYAHNNLHIIGGIREQLEQNIQKKEEKQTPSTTKLQNELLQKQKEDIKKNLKKILMLMIYYKLNYYYKYWLQ